MTEDKLEQLLNAFLPIEVTLSGILIDVNLAHFSNMLSLIAVSSSERVMVERALHSLKA